MDLVSTSINAAVVALVGLVLAWLGKGRFGALDRRIDRLEASIDSMRSDLTHVALAVGARRRATNA